MPNPKTVKHNVGTVEAGLVTGFISLDRFIKFLIHAQKEESDKHSKKSPNSNNIQVFKRFFHPQFLVCLDSCRYCD